MPLESDTPLLNLETALGTGATALTSHWQVLDAFLRSSADAIFVVDRAGRYLYVGEAGARALGKCAADMLGKTNVALGFAADVAADLASQTEQVFCTKQPVGGTSLISTVNGLRLYEHNFSPVCDEQGHVTAMLCIARDVTERHRQETFAREQEQRIQMALRASEERYRSLVEMSTPIVWTTDGFGAFITPQIEWERYTGQPWEEHRGFGWANMVHPDDREQLVATWERTLAESTPYHAEGRLWHAPSQQYRHFTTQAVGMQQDDGTFREWIGSVEDVDDAKRREAEILALNARLRLSIQETHHRVKNNLQIISAMMDMSLMDAEDSLPLSDARRIANQIQTLAKVHDILTVEAKADRFGEDVSARTVLERLLPMLQTTSGLQVDAEIDDALLSIPQATSLALIVNELASNAVKYGQGHVHIAFTVSEDQALLTVTDDGPGFPAGFDVHTAANTGLMIVEQIVRHDLRGTLHFANQENQGGAEVRVLLPLHIAVRS